VHKRWLAPKGGYQEASSPGERSPTVYRARHSSVLNQAQFLAGEIAMLHPKAV